MSEPSDKETIDQPNTETAGLKEKPDEESSTTYKEMTDLLKPITIKESGKSISVKPKIVISVTYQNIQKSPSYSSGFALRFPRITHYRPDRKPFDITTLNNIEREVEKTQRK